MSIIILIVLSWNFIYRAESFSSLQLWLPNNGKESIPLPNIQKFLIPGLIRNPPEVTSLQCIISQTRLIHGSNEKTLCLIFPPQVWLVFVYCVLMAGVWFWWFGLWFWVIRFMILVNPLATMVHYTDTLMKILLVRFKAYLTTRDQWECLPWSPDQTVQSKSPRLSSHNSVSR